ncbi:hypothetical protein HK105_202490 [Polyrhizophydium stewartii]|uniref:Uncharacterized protein n=1 Tax=Polyrhizophydium stewartii TaxID=2732419 RepID=A0ABR4NF49_9FUNG
MVTDPDLALDTAGGLLSARAPPAQPKLAAVQSLAAAPVALEPARVAVQMMSEHRGLVVTNDDTKFLKLAGGCSALVTARFGRIPSVSRVGMHLEAISQLDEQARELMSDDETQFPKIKLSMAYVGFTDAKCVDFVSDLVVRDGSLDAHRSVVTAGQIYETVAKGCRLPFLISIEIEVAHAPLVRTLGRLILADLYAPSFVNLPERKPPSLPATIAAMRELATIIATPGMAGVLPYKSSLFTSMVPELFGGAAVSTFPLDPTCAASDVMPALEFFDLMRKVRNKASIHVVSEQILRLEALTAFEKNQNAMLDVEKARLAEDVRLAREQLGTLRSQVDVQIPAAQARHQHRLADINGHVTTITLFRRLEVAHRQTDAEVLAEELRRERVLHVISRHEREQRDARIERDKIVQEELAEQIRLLMVAKDALAAEVAEIAAQLEARIADLSQLEAALMQYAEAAQAAVDGANSQIAKLDTAIADAETRLVHASEREARQASKIDGMSQQLREADAAAEAGRLARDELAQQLDVLRAERVAAADQISELGTKLQAAQDELSQARGAMETERATHLAQIEALRQREDTWKAEITKSLGALEKTTSATSEKEHAEIGQLRRDMEAVVRANQDLRAALEMEREKRDEQASALLAAIAEKNKSIADAAEASARAVAEITAMSAAAQASAQSAPAPAPSQAAQPKTQRKKPPKSADKPVESKPAADAEPVAKAPKAASKADPAKEPVKEHSAGRAAKQPAAEPPASIEPQAAAEQPASQQTVDPAKHVSPAPKPARNASPESPSSDMDLDSDSGTDVAEMPVPALKPKAEAATSSKSSTVKAPAKASQSDKPKATKASKKSSEPKAAKQPAEPKESKEAKHAKALKAAADASDQPETLPARKKRPPPKPIQMLPDSDPSDSAISDEDVSEFINPEVVAPSPRRRPARGSKRPAPDANSSADSEIDAPAKPRKADKTSAAASKQKPSKSVSRAADPKPEPKTQKEDKPAKKDAAAAPAVDPKTISGDATKKDGKRRKVDAGESNSRADEEEATKANKADTSLFGMLSFLNTPTTTEPGVGSSSSATAVAAPAAAEASAPAPAATAAPLVPRLPRHVLDRRRLALIGK